MYKNEDLKPVFEILLTELEKNKIDYWIFGGISIAAYVDEFIRENKDVDIFVKSTDFEKAKKILIFLCNKNNFEFKNYFKKKGDRLKFEIKINGVERFSMIAIYQINNEVLFKYDDGDQIYSNKILEKVERNIYGYKFFTPKDEFIKEMFINHIKVRPNKKKRPKIIKDAKAILNLNELNDFGFDKIINN